MKAGASACLTNIETPVNSYLQLTVVSEQTFQCVSRDNPREISSEGRREKTSAAASQQRAKSMPQYVVVDETPSPCALAACGLCVLAIVAVVSAVEAAVDFHHDCDLWGELFGLCGVLWLAYTGLALVLCCCCALCCIGRNTQEDAADETVQV